MRFVPYLLLSAMAIGICAGLSCPRKCKRKWCIEYVESQLQCAGNLVKDICGCCYECAKQLNESCGGMWREHGHCDVGMECYYSYHTPPGYPITHPGTCIRKRKCHVYGDDWIDPGQIINMDNCTHMCTCKEDGTLDCAKIENACSSLEYGNHTSTKD